MTKDFANPGQDTTLNESWRLLLACALGVGFGSIGFNTYAIGAFVDPLRADFGWSRTEVQWAIAFGTGLGGFAAPLVGVAIDRYGGRAIALWGLVGVAVGYLMAAGSLGKLWYFYLSYAAVALLGAGSGPVSWTRAIASNFRQKRGLALALTLSGTGFSAIIVPPYAVFVVQTFGWRAGYLALAILPLIAVSVAFFFFRPSAVAQEAEISRSMLELQGTSLREALTSYRFWLLLVSILVIYVGITGIVPNLLPALTDQGFSPRRAATIQSAYGFSLIITRLGIGWLLDRFWGPGIASIVLMLPAGACIILTHEPNYLAAMLASALIGAAAGAELDLLAYFAARYFGLRNYGWIYGLLYTGVAFGAGLGPISFAYLSGIAGSYTASFHAVFFLFCCGGLSILFLGRYPEFPEAPLDVHRRNA